MSSEPTSDAQARKSAQAAQEEQDRSICIRSVKTSCLFGLIIFALCWATHHHDWAWGFLIGGFLSLFSMVTLMLAVPFLTWSGAPRHMSAMLIVTLYMKLPIFCFGLYLATNVPGVSAFACFLGICLAPAVITLKAVNNLLKDALPARQPKAAVAVRPDPIKPQVQAKPARKVTIDLAPEQG